MFSVKGYFDGHNYITDGKAAVKPNQRVIITVLDDPSEESVSKGSADFDAAFGLWKDRESPLDEIRAKAWARALVVDS